MKMERQISVRLIRAIKEDHLENIPVEQNRNLSICLSTIVFGSLGTIEITRSHRLMIIRRIISSVRTFFITSNLQGLQKRKTKAVKTVNVYIIASVSYLMFICILLFATFAFWQTSILSCTFNDRSIDSQQELG